MKRYLPCHRQNAFAQRTCQNIAMLLGVPLVVMLTIGPVASARGPQVLSEEAVAERAKGAWKNGAINSALDILDQGIQDNPQALTLHKLRGDVLATSRRPREAVEAYESVLARKPTALDVRWAKWSVLIRSGQGEASIAELQRIAHVDVQNPLIHLRLALELRNLDRLEESLVSYKKAVQLVPDFLSWRLGLARAYFDVLDYQGAQDEVDYVLQRVPPGSTLELLARNLLSLIYGSSKDRGRRFAPVYTPNATAGQLKEWAIIRGDAWRLYAAGRYAEAEPVYRSALALNPGDPTATHQLALILMELGRCEEAIPFFKLMSNVDSTEEQYADTVFRIGQCLVELEQWSEALVHFQVLYQAAVEFEERNKNVQRPPATRVLDKEKLARWIDKVHPHVPNADRIPSGAPSGLPGLSEEEVLTILAEKAAEIAPEKELDEQVSLMGRDSDFSWFRFVIPASGVMRDDFPTGWHEFIPIDPEDSFAITQREIYLVFRLASASFDALLLTAQCSLETSEVTRKPRGLAKDQVIMSTNDRSGYFILSPPETGWTPGLYRCGLFVGERTSADTHVDEVRFRINEPPVSSMRKPEEPKPTDFINSLSGRTLPWSVRDSSAK